MKEKNFPGISRVERIKHRPYEEDVISILSIIREPDMSRGRFLATKAFWEEKISLAGKYSPGSYSTYDIRKGAGYSLILVDDWEEEVYVVESSMEGLADALDEQRKEERRIFEKLGINFPEEIDEIFHLRL
ncbi:hypothetical protein FHG64_13100 [Antarcticibacterium flavum]|uniref:Uncharacterized protein n=1 Tax=Antarcticibacterium flavum TaxID=2058175 RepID=A0A5B7X449_9FLAO|nr:MULTISPECIES: hypothetical protein [Antarcticibacterium]MCM4158516.1 hypothetical protein [Antarcticibacterium sp. W02-3]QCY70264.1 hypothetical protein FHG64_13100 [Antarcticibacterium flavum]